MAQKVKTLRDYFSVMSNEERKNAIKQSFALAFRTLQNEKDRCFFAELDEFIKQFPEDKRQGIYNRIWLIYVSAESLNHDFCDRVDHFIEWFS